MENLLKGVVENGEILHHIGTREELLSLLGVVHLHKDLELLLLAEKLHLNLGLGTVLRASIGSRWNQSLNTPLNRVDLHFIFMGRLNMQFEDIRSRLLINDP